MNESTVIPLNGVSRVRIPPPPPVSTPAAPACQPGASRLSARFGPAKALAFLRQLLPFGPRCAAHGEPFPAAVGFHAFGEAPGRLAEMLRAADRREAAG